MQRISCSFFNFGGLSWSVQASWLLAIVKGFGKCPGFKSVVFCLLFDFFGVFCSFFYLCYSASSAASTHSFLSLSFSSVFRATSCFQLFGDFCLSELRLLLYFQFVCCVGGPLVVALQLGVILRVKGGAIGQWVWLADYTGRFSKIGQEWFPNWDLPLDLNWRIR